MRERVRERERVRVRVRERVRVRVRVRERVRERERERVRGPGRGRAHGASQFRSALGRFQFGIVLARVQGKPRLRRGGFALRRSHPGLGLRAMPEARSASEREQKGFAMLKIYPVILEVVRKLGPVVQEVHRTDPDLGRQMRRALSSVPLNVSEGMYNRGGHRKQRYLTAMGSMRETLGCIETAQAMGYLDEVGGDVLDGIDHVIRVLYNLTNA